MPVSNEKPILVNGAGIAGLTVALTLADAGYQVILHEKAEGFETIGAGIQISPNATRILSGLGLAAPIGAVATEPDCIELNNGETGKRLARIPLADSIRKKFSYPYQVIHRADLQTILAGRCQGHPNIKILLSAEIVEMAPHARGLTVMYMNEGKYHERSAVAVIAADGVWSRLRTRVLDLPPPEYSGKVAWRALIPSDFVTNDDWLRQTTVWFGEGSHVVCYPVRSGEYLNIVVITKGPETNFGQQLSIEMSEVEERFTMSNGSFVSLLQQKARWTGWPIFETPTNSPTTFGPVGLIGDAAHAMLPFAAQGAAMAIEDAAILSKMFRECETASDAMKQYALCRKKRIERMAKTAQKNGKIYHLAGVSAKARDLGIWLTPSSILSARQSWIYGWTP